MPRVIVGQRQSTTAADEVDVHPAWYFILFLLVASDDPSRDTINTTLQNYGLAKCSDRCYREAVDKVGALPEDFFLGSASHRESSKYLKKLRIHSMAHPDEVQEELRKKILQAPLMRARLDTLLLGKVGTREISFKLRKAEMPISALAIEEYRHYFWNTDVMSLENWASYLEADSDGRTGKLHTSDRLTAVLLCGPSVAIQKAGLEQILDRQKILDELQTELYTSFLEVKHLPLSDKKIEMLSNITRSLLRVDERQSASDTALQDVLRRFERFKVKGETALAPTLFALAPTGSISDKNREEIVSSREK